MRYNLKAYWVNIVLSHPVFVKCWRIKSLTGNIRMKHRRFVHKPWPLSANAEGYGSRDRRRGKHLSTRFHVLDRMKRTFPLPTPPLRLSEGCSTFPHMGSGTEAIPSPPVTWSFRVTWPLALADKGHSLWTKRLCYIRIFPLNDLILQH